MRPVARPKPRKGSQEPTNLYRIMSKTIPNDSTAPLFASVKASADYASDGLTKREYFAAIAMQGLLACESNNNESYARIAEWAVKHADALITALNGEFKPTNHP